MMHLKATLVLLVVTWLGCLLLSPPRLHAAELSPPQHLAEPSSAWCVTSVQLSEQQSEQLAAQVKKDLGSAGQNSARNLGSEAPEALDEGAASPGWTALTLEDARFIQPLQLQRMPAQPRCLPGQPDTLSLLDKVDKALEFERKEDAEALLGRFAEVFACEQQPVSQVTLARVLEQHALLNILNELPEDGYYREALNIYPELMPRQDFGTAVTSAYNAAQQLRKSQTSVPLKLPETTLEGWNLWVDGQRVEARGLQLPMGRHFFQLLDVEGQVRVSRMLVVEPRPGSIWPPEQQLPPGRQQLLLELRTGLSNGILSAELQEALKGLQSGLKLEQVLLLGQTEAETLSGWRVQGGQLSRVRYRVNGVGAPVKRHSGKLVAGLLGGVALGLGGWTGYQYMTLNGTSVGSPGERDVILTRYAFSMGGTSAAALGALVSTGLVLSGKW